MFPKKKDSTLTLPTGEENTLALPRKEVHTLIPPTKGLNRLFPSRKDGNLVISPTKDDSALALPKEEGNTLVPERKEGNLLAPPTSRVFPSRKENNSVVFSTKENNTSIVPRKENNALVSPNTTTGIAEENEKEELKGEDQIPKIDYELSQEISTEEKKRKSEHTIESKKEKKVKKDEDDMIDVNFVSKSFIEKTQSCNNRLLNIGEELKRMELVIEDISYRTSKLNTEILLLRTPIFADSIEEINQTIDECFNQLGNNN